LMQTPILPSSGISHIGLSWFITDVDGVTLIGHGGGTNGQITYLRIVPSRNFALAVFTNSDEGDVFCDAADASGLKYYLGLSLPEALPLDLPEEQLRGLLGKYDSSGLTCELVLQDGGLVLLTTMKGGFPTPDSPPPPSPPPMRVGIYAEDRIVVLDDPMKSARGEILRNPDKSIAWLRLGGRIHKKLA
jgi:hypothetical protein